MYSSLESLDDDISAVPPPISSIMSSYSSLLTLLNNSSLIVMIFSMDWSLFPYSSLALSIINLYSSVNIPVPLRLLTSSIPSTLSYDSVILLPPALVYRNSLLSGCMNDCYLLRLPLKSVSSKAEVLLHPSSSYLWVQWIGGTGMKLFISRNFLVSIKFKGLDSPRLGGST